MISVLMKFEIKKEFSEDEDFFDRLFSNSEKQFNP